MAAERTRSSIDPVPLRIVDYLEPAFRRLDELTMLQPGWDSYDAEPISPVAIRTARGLLILSADHLRR